MQPDQKIDRLRMGIGALEQHQTALLEAKDAVENRSLTGTQVSHAGFGSGQVITQTGKLFTVAFDATQKQFLYPDAFQLGHLTTGDTALQADMEKYKRLVQRLEDMQSRISAAQRCMEKLQRK